MKRTVILQERTSSALTGAESRAGAQRRGKSWVPDSSIQTSIPLEEVVACGLWMEPPTIRFCFKSRR